MLTVGRLKEILNQYSDDMPVVVCVDEIGYDYQDAEVSEQRIEKDPDYDYAYNDFVESRGRGVIHALLIS